ncbi:MAG: sodium-dependent transporter [Alteromonadaceae bacterium]|jgi:NSS family neurotransmitter:Na+ symporter|uniref:Neurotransmitter:Na+ symporter, NSS family n=2 Tax=Paraglaciecola mesophila TaxID=197222 RepID=K6YZ97_9ALTE|nr:sodium-dependent transporter [Paraglaciecola mesophila]MAD16018.1 sodium-dependent transporter [Alteromonadaceae bacterium]MBB18594.1 sodium-dependent transporter [Rickettsiales bacterium]GAC23482.1 neurotransmitter:Na+ symporter, NSS family [Paraglaciecola mesophila KMM 241]|tara:strand:+ start:3402 stop:4823 length:1422 start_codon:yes stop_codon:yes gene_type:complete
MGAPREQFGSRLGFILAAAGSAVGIGNMVGFPVAATKNGGGAFLLMYAIFVAFICLPVMLAEMSVGRASRKDPLGAYNVLSDGQRHWKIAGWLATITPFMIAIFYLVLTVWIFGYLVQCILGNLDVLADPSTFGVFINGYELFYYMIGVLIIVYMILQGGVKQGIEKAAKLMMPTLFVMLIGLVIFVLTLDNAFEGVKYYLIPDFNKIDAAVVSAALSQAFFSLSLGMGIMLTYGSYLDKHADVPGSAKLVALMDTAVAFIAGLLILPAVFSFNPNTDTESLSDSSVGMIFTFLPKIFLALQGTIGYTGASIVASLFFLLVFFAAITSLVSIFEVPVSALMEDKGYSRKKSLAILGGLLVVMSIAAATSFGISTFFTEFLTYAGQTKSVFDVIIDVFYDTILPFNGLLVCLFVIYRWKKSNLNTELDLGAPKFANSWFEKYVNFSLGTFIPVILLLVFINTVALKYFGSALIG